MLIRCRSVWLSTLLPADLADQPAAIKDQDPVTKADQLRQFGRTEKDDAPIRGHPPNQLVDFALRPNVNPARGIVEKNHPRLDLEPFADDHFLLVPARQMVDERVR